MMYFRVFNGRVHLGLLAVSSCGHIYMTKLNRTVTCSSDAIGQLRAMAALRLVRTR